MENVKADRLHKKLIIGVEHEGVVLKDYSLLRSNGIAERVFTDKSQAKPYTWMAKVISIATQSIGSVEIGMKCREQYAKNETISIPDIVKRIPLQDASAMITEIHRSVWKRVIPDVQGMCKWCGTAMTMNVDLDNIKMEDADIQLLASRTDWTTFIVDVPYGYAFAGLSILGSQQTVGDDLKGLVFNRFVFRMPTLGDALNNEKLTLDSIQFWRKIAYDCMIGVQAVTPLTDAQLDHLESTGTRASVYAEGRTVLGELPDNLKNILGMQMFNSYLDKADLEEIRFQLRDNIPTLPFYYMEQCSNPTCRKDTPVTVDANDFFSE